MEGWASASWAPVLSPAPRKVSCMQHTTIQQAGRSLWKQEAGSRQQAATEEEGTVPLSDHLCQSWALELYSPEQPTPLCPALHGLLQRVGAAPHLLGFLGLLLDKSLGFLLPQPLLLRLLCLQGQGCPQYLCFSFTAESSVWLCRKELKEQAVEWERLVRTAPSRRMQPHLAGPRGWCKCMEAGPGHPVEAEVSKNR